jgi:GTP-dependent phosphoenolpyruvate carboxykinase
VPTSNALTLDGLDVSRSTMDSLLSVDSGDWSKEHIETGKFFEEFGSRLPEGIRDEHKRLGERLQRVSVTPK